MRFDENCRVPLPVNFNCWKHHAGFINYQVIMRRKNNISAAQLKKLLLKIGNSQMDIYLGRLSPEAICDEIVIKLKNSGNYSQKKYREWINVQGEGYKLLKLSDKSIWALRSGNQLGRYIHIHPGRYSPNTVRVKALTLKTAIPFMIKQNYNSPNRPDLKIINNLRKNLLGISPLKSVSGRSGLGKFLVQFNTLKE